MIHSRGDTNRERRNEKNGTTTKALVEFSLNIPWFRRPSPSSAARLLLFRSEERECDRELWRRNRFSILIRQARERTGLPPRLRVRLRFPPPPSHSNRTEQPWPYDRDSRSHRRSLIEPFRPTLWSGPANQNCPISEVWARTQCHTINPSDPEHGPNRTPAQAHV